MDIKVLGPGCAKCNELEKLVHEAAAEAGINAQVEKVGDLQEIAHMGVFSTPALVVDGKIKAVGKVPTKKDIIAWLKG
jgi:small redox-active disulfide protein 2